MAEIELVLDQMIHRELQMASNHATRATIKLRVLLKLMHALDVPLQWIYDTKNLIRVDESISRNIEGIWGILFDTYPPNLESSASSTHLQPTAEESALVEKFLAKDFVKNQDICKLITILTKKYQMHREIWYILAVDGLYPSQDMDDLKMYYDNLTIGYDTARNESIDPKSQIPEEKSIRYLRREHVKGVRAVYNHLKETKPIQIAQVLRKIFKFHEVPSKTSHHNMSSQSSESSETYSKTHTDDENSNPSVGCGVPFSPVEASEQNSTEKHSQTPPIEDTVTQYDKTLENRIECCYRFAVPDKHTLLAIAEWKKKELAQCERMAEKRSKGANKRKSGKKLKITKQLEVPETISQKPEKDNCPEEVAQPDVMMDPHTKKEMGKAEETKIPKEKKTKTKEGPTESKHKSIKVKDPSKKLHKSANKTVTEKE